MDSDEKGLEVSASTDWQNVQDELLDLPPMEGASIPQEVVNEFESSTSSGYLSAITDNELDSLILWLRAWYTRAGIRMLDGMLRRLGHIVPYKRIRLSLLQVDPVHREIIIHSFIDSYSHIITGLLASGNNHTYIMLLLFLSAISVFGIPLCLHGDHGIENVWVAAFIDHIWGRRLGAYIWGRLVHNELFEELEAHHGLKHHNHNYLWLLHLLFLPLINEHLTFWAESWNHHRITIWQGGPSCSPYDMFRFDMLVCGWRGGSLEDHRMSQEELEVFGINWKGLHDDVLLQQICQEYVEDGADSWLRRQGPPLKTSRVPLDNPANPFTEDQTQWLRERAQELPTGANIESVQTRWIYGLAYARQVNSDAF
ncbi:hypothetical protein Moror_3271 [Moniliophthora roreri MCA 2997]|uniref:Integrase core domain-containing protein n=2 Tax=Moniliophthora roreri TaxID=221103 RepID=V2W8U1_MONRO|nr:hypothetical protein Moror_3271 [Moniliophthora roreri MCA 2997]